MFLGNMLSGDSNLLRVFHLQAFVFKWELFRLGRGALNKRKRLK